MSTAEPRPSSVAPEESRIARNFLALGAGEVISRVIAFFAYVYLARALGAAGYGTIAFVVGLQLYLTKIADFGIESVGTSHVAQAPQGVRGFASAILGARLLVTGAMIVLSAALAQWILPEPERTVMLLYLITLLPIAANAKWVHLGLQNALPVGLSRVLGEAVFLAVVVVFVRQFADLWKVPLGALAGESSAALLLYLLLLWRGLGFGLTWNPSVALPVFRRAAPLVAQIMLGLFIYNSDLVFLRVMRDGATVGYYAAAYMLLSFLGNVATSYGMSLMPALARHRDGGPEELALYQKSLAQMYAVVLPVTVGGWLTASEVITLWFGPDYGPAGSVLGLLIWAFLPTTFRISPWVALVARGKQGLLLRATVFAALANAALNLALIGPYGMYGAAAATIATESIAACLMLAYAAREGLSLLAPVRLLAPTFASLIMAGVLLNLEDFGIFVQIPVGALLYALCLILTRALRFQGLRPVLRV